MRRVLVIGGGIAGLTAALSAARAGADATLLQVGQGAHHLFSGCVDVLTYPQADGEAVAQPLTALADLCDDHPYAKVGVEAVREALAEFKQIVGEQDLTYVGDGENQKRVLTAMGTFRHTALTPATMAIDPAEIDVVCGLAHFRNFAESMIAAELSRRIGRPVKTLLFTLEKGRRDAVGISSRLRREEEFSALAEFLAAEAKGATVALPAVLPVENAEAIKAQIEEHFGGRLVEVPGLPPSLAGLRLMKALRRAALDASVASVPNARAIGPVEENGRIVGINVQTGNVSRELRTDAIVLATGHLVGGGLVSARGRLREAVFGLPLRGWSRGPFFAERFLATEGHPVLQAGVPVDAHLHPVKDGGAVCRNLYACGDILAGFDPYRERSGGGVALSTGMVAGRLAARGES